MNINNQIIQQKMLEKTKTAWCKINLSILIRGAASPYVPLSARLSTHPFQLAI